MSLTRTALKLLGAYVLLTVLATAFGTIYADVWFEPVAVTVGYLCPFIDVDGVQTTVAGGEHWFELHGVTREALALPEGIIPAGTAMSTATLHGHAFIHVVLIGSILVAWPCSCRAQRLKLVATCVAAVVLATLLDIPFVLAGAAADEVAAAGDSHDVLVGYYRFIDAGGRPVLSLLGAASAILLSSSGHTGLAE